MACELSTVQASACISGIGRLDGQVQLLQVIAQSDALLLAEVSPGAEVTLAAIQERACSTGIGRIDNPIVLLQVIAQNLCNQIE